METNDKNLKLFNFLRWLHDETKADFKQLALGKKLEEYEVKQAGIVATHIIKMGIVKTKKEGTNVSYKWADPDAPTIKMSDQLINAVTEYWRERDKKLKDKKTDKIIPKHKRNLPLMKNIPSPPPKKKNSKLDKLAPDKDKELIDKLSLELNRELALIDKNAPHITTQKYLEHLSDKLSLGDIILIMKKKGITGKLSISKTIEI